MHLPSRPSLPVSVLLATALGASLAGQEPLHTLPGDSINGRLGSAVSLAGDVDGDGFADVIAGAPTGNAGGTATVLSGRDGSVLYHFTAAATGDLFGLSVSGVGDVNRDGFADVAVGAPGAVPSTGAATGRVQVFSGKDGSVLHTFDGETGSGLGTAVSGAGDVDADGYPDIVVGAPTASTAGNVRVFSGRDGALLHSFAGDRAADQLGAAVSGAGDVNDDGFADVIAGARYTETNGLHSGSARVFSGLDGSVLHTFLGDGAGDLFGVAVSGAGDLDGDGCADLIVGAPGDDNLAPTAGSARVFSGRDGSVMFTFDGDSALEAVGSTVAGTSDVDSDGCPDLIVGAPGDDRNGPNTGSVHVFSGKDGHRIYTFSGEVPGDKLGQAVGGGGDVDCDTVDDVVVGLPGTDANAPDAGSVMVLRSVAGLKEYADTYTISRMYDVKIGAAGDVNGDGYADIVVGYPQDTTHGINSGRARVHSGRDGAPLPGWDKSDRVGGDRTVFGYAVSGAGDVNGDGLADVIIGQPRRNGLRGAAWVYTGPGGALVLWVEGQGANDLFGSDVSSAGDVDGDGFDDVIIGAPGFNVVGHAEVFSIQKFERLYTFTGVTARDSFGDSVSGAGDMNGDGFDDMIVGARDADFGGKTDCGTATVYSGQDGSVLYTFAGDAPIDQLGAAVSEAGDVNGDGYADVIVGAPGSGGLTDYARVYSGVDGSILHTFVADRLMSFGRAVDSAGDVDADGFDDVLVAANAENGITGVVRLFSGATGEVLRTFEGTETGQGLGRDVAGLGDINADGVPDFGFETQHRFLRIVASVPTTAGKFTTFGSACAGPDGRLPRIQTDQRPQIGQGFTLELTAAIENAAAALHVDPAPQDIDLGFLGLSGCSLLALPVFSFPTSTDAIGAASLQLPIPNLAALVGASLHAQWLTIGAAGPSLALSDGAVLTFGKR